MWYNITKKKKIERLEILMPKYTLKNKKNPNVTMDVSNCLTNKKRERNQLEVHN